MSTIVIKYNGTDITEDVVLRDAEFRSRTDASIGDAIFRVLDRKGGFYTKDYFKAGNEVTLDVDGVRVWGGYVYTVSYDYPGVAWKIEPATPRFFSIKCVDYNILFHRRVLWNKARPEYQMKQYTASGGPDSDKAIIRDMVNLYLDLSGDGFQSGGSDAIDLSNVIELGDIFWLANCSTTWQAASPGMKWGDGMRHIASWSGAVFYIGPANPSQTHKGPTLYYHDVNTKTGPYELNDRPASDPGSAGVQSFEYIEDITQMATEALVWGAGMGSDEMVFWRETADAAVAEYGTWQWGDFVTTMWLLECIQHRAKTYVHGSRQNKRGHKQPKKSWKATIFTPDFQVGDVVDMHSYVFDIQDNVPIREITITFIGPTTPRFDLLLSHEMDTAYGTAMWWDPDDPARPDREGPGDGGGGFGNTWYTQTIPLGIGPIITPGPESPPLDGRYNCYPGPEAALVDKIRWWSDGTVERLGPDFIPFDGNTEFGSYLERINNVPWYACPCPGVGLGCWWGRSVKLQFVYQIHIPEGFNNTLYVLGEKIRYQGQPGEFVGTLITSEDEYQHFHEVDYDGDASKVPVPGMSMGGGSLGGTGTYQPNNGMDGGFYDPTVTGEPIVKVGNQDVMEGRLPPLQNGECAYYHWYSGCWGGYSSIPTISIDGAPPGQNIYLVFTPKWEVEPVHNLAQAYCDVGYWPNSIAAGQGPAAEGLGGSGSYELPLTLDTIYCGDSGYDDTGPSPLDNTGVGYYQGPADYVYYTHFPYVPGSLEVYVGGIPYHSFVEMDPATGQFSVHIGGIYSYGAFDIRYMASSPDPTEFGGMGDYNSEEGVDNNDSDEGGPVGGAVLRPRFVSAFGWQSEFDGANVPFAQICHFIERTTQGTRLVTPPQVRSSSGISHLGQISLANIRDILNIQGVGYWFPGTVSFETLKSGINEGRGAILVGDPVAMGAFAPFTGLGTFDGPHALYINEIRNDGWMLVYDSAMRLPDDGVFYVPESIIKDYAASGANDRYGIANVIFTYRTQRV